MTYQDDPQLRDARDLRDEAWEVFRRNALAKQKAMGGSL